MEDDNIGIIYLLLGSLSTISGVSVIIVYFLTGSWREPPSTLIFWHLFSQSFIDATIATAGFSIVIYRESLDHWCKNLGAFNIYFYFLGFNYVVCLCLEVLFKLHRPMENSYKKRSKVYHLASHLSSLTLVLFIYFNHDSGPSFNHFCFIDKNSDFHYVSSIPLIIFFPVLILTYFQVYKMKVTTAFVNFFVKKHLIYITAYFCVWLPVILNILVQHEHNLLNQLSLVLISSSGFILTIIRVLALLYVKRLRYSKRSCTAKMSIASMINETLKENPKIHLLDDEMGIKSDYVGVFSDVSKESALTALVIFHYSLLFAYPSKIEVEPPWAACYYTDRRAINIDRNHLDLLVLPQSLKFHCIF